jgi:hypothetical protein
MVVRVHWSTYLVSHNNTQEHTERLKGSTVMFEIHVHAHWYMLQLNFVSSIEMSLITTCQFRWVERGTVGTERIKTAL